MLIGGDGNDAIDGNGGSDFLDGGDGDDTFVWDPGDGSDVVEGEEGADTLIFRGSDGGERIDLSANGDRLRLVRDVGTVTMDVDDVERVNVLTLGGQDTVTVSDLSATDVTAVDVNLGADGSANGDLLADNVVVNGSGGDDRITVSEIAGAPVVIRPTTIVRVTGADPTLDTLTVNGLAGNDTIDASGLPAGLIGLTVNLGDGQAAAATTTTLSTSTAYAVFGQAEVLTATVSSPTGTPTGSVTFLDGNTVLGTAPVNAAGQAILAVSLGVGNHALTASFAGSGDFTGSSSAVVVVTVDRAATATS